LLVAGGAPVGVRSVVSGVVRAARSEQGCSSAPQVTAQRGRGSCAVGTESSRARARLRPCAAPLGYAHVYDRPDMSRLGGLQGAAMNTRSGGMVAQSGGAVAGATTWMRQVAGSRGQSGAGDWHP